MFKSVYKGEKVGRFLCWTCLFNPMSLAHAVIF